MANEKTEIMLDSIGMVYKDQGGNDVTALTNVTLDIKKGEFISLLGPSGCGKTTLLRILGGFLQPSEGKVLFDGEDIVSVPPYKREINTVFQKYALFPHMDVYDNIAFGLTLKKEPKDVIEQKVMRMLRLVSLEDYAHRNVTELSGGQQQRIAIARALATHPKVLLCDEATSALDPNTTRQILELIRDINRKLNITVVVITHQMSVVKEICSHVAILDEGQVAEAGLVGTVFAAPKSAAGRRLVFPGGADAQVYDPAEEKLVRLVFKDSKTTSIPLIARLAAEEGIFCNVISASTQKLSEKVYGSMMLGIPSSQFDKAVAFIHNVANVQVEEVE